MSEQEFHDRFYAAEAERIFSSPLYRRLVELQVEFLIQVTPGLDTGRILSLGCGDGRRELAMARHAGHIVGIDVSPVGIERARQRARALGVHNVEFQVGDVEQLAPRFRAEFDAVWCAGVLHHLPEAQILALMTMSRSVLMAGGRFISMDPNAQRAVNLFKPFFRRAYDRYHSIGERELRPRQVAGMLRSSGFRRIRVCYTDAFISPLAWVFPHLPAPLAPWLAGLDQLLVKTPVVNALSSGFAVVAETEA